MDNNLPTDNNQETGDETSNKSKKIKNIVSILGLFLIIVSLPLTIVLVKQRQEIRKNAAGQTCGGWCASIVGHAEYPWCICNGDRSPDSNYQGAGQTTTSDCTSSCTAYSSKSSSQTSAGQPAQTPAGQTCGGWCASKVGHADFPWCICNGDRSPDPNYQGAGSTTTSDCTSSCIVYSPKPSSQASTIQSTQTSSGTSTSVIGSGGGNSAGNNTTTATTTDDSKCTNIGGVCKYTSETCGENGTGIFKQGYCSGPTNRQCCIPPSSSTSITTIALTATADDSKCTNIGGVCKYTSETCGENNTGVFKPGYCSGPTNRQCCTPPTTTASTTTSTAVTTDTATTGIGDDSRCTSMGGVCKDTAEGCGENNTGVFKQGYCSGPAERQCCTPPSPSISTLTPTPTPIIYIPGIGYVNPTPTPKVQKYSCNSLLGRCEANDSGSYTSLSLCQLDCKVPATETYGGTSKSIPTPTPTPITYISGIGYVNQNKSTQTLISVTPNRVRYHCGAGWSCVPDFNGQFMGIESCKSFCVKPVETNSFLSTSQIQALINNVHYHCGAGWSCIADSNGPYLGLESCKSLCKKPVDPNEFLLSTQQIQTLVNNVKKDEEHIVMSPPTSSQLALNSVLSGVGDFLQEGQDILRNPWKEIKEATWDPVYNSTTLSQNKTAQIINNEMNGMNQSWESPIVQGAVGLLMIAAGSPLLNVVSEVGLAAPAVKTVETALMEEEVVKGTAFLNANKTPAVTNGAIADVQSFIDDGIGMINKGDSLGAVDYFTSNKAEQLAKNSGLSLGVDKQTMITDTITEKDIKQILYEQAEQSIINNETGHMKIMTVDAAALDTLKHKVMSVKLPEEVTQNMALVCAEEWCHGLQYLNGGGSISQVAARTAYSIDSEIDVALYLNEQGAPFTLNWLKNHSERLTDPLLSGIVAQFESP